MKDNIRYIKEKQLQKTAQKNYDNFCKNSSVENPIKEKFLAFQKTKKDINLRDLF